MVCPKRKAKRAIRLGRLFFTPASTMLPALIGRSSMIRKNGNYFCGKIMRLNNGLRAFRSLHLNPSGLQDQCPTPNAVRTMS